MYGVANALYWKSSERKISTHLTVMRHQNTKTSLYKLSKNHWVIALLEIFGSVRKKLQFTVFNDHPVFVRRVDRIHKTSHITMLPFYFFPSDLQSFGDELNSSSKTAPASACEKNFNVVSQAIKVFLQKYPR